MICLHHRTKRHGQTQFDPHIVSFFPGTLSGDIVGKRACENPNHVRQNLADLFGSALVILRRPRHGQDTAVPTGL